MTIISEQSVEDDFDLLDVTVKVNPHGKYDLVDFTLIKGLMLESPDGAGFRLSYQRDRRATPTEKPVAVDIGDGVTIQREGA